MTVPEHLQKKSDETLKEYKIRLCDNKETYNVSWEEVKDLINSETGDTWGESKYRKWWYSFAEGMEFAKLKDTTDQDVLDELELKRMEIEEERVKLQSIRVDYNRIRREKSRKDLMYEKIQESIETLPVPEFDVEIPLHRSENNREAVLAFGDAHWGLISESINNSYSPEIFEERMKVLIENTVHTLKEKEDFTHVTVLNLADSIEGMTLRISQLQTLRTGFIGQTIEFSKFMASWLNELSKHFHITYRSIPSSNHSEVRPFNTNRGEFPAEDLERIIIHYLHDVLADNPRIEIPIYDENVIEFKLAGYEHVATHGHSFRINKNTIRDLSMQRQKFFQYLWVAHFHHSDVVTVNENEKGNVEMIRIPSIMGSDNYSDSLMTGSKAGAVINIFEEGKGRTTQYNITLN